MEIKLFGGMSDAEVGCYKDASWKENLRVVA